MEANNKRLDFLVDILPKEIVLADIGTDHAYLPIKVVRAGKAQLVYAADLKEKPLNQAKINIAKAQLSEMILPILSDGLSYFKERQVHLDYVVIAGLGASTIAEILQNDYAGVENYLICSNTNPIILRKLIKQKHWFLDNEFFIIDNQKHYWILNINKQDGVKLKTRRDIYLGTSPDLLNDIDYRHFLISEYEKNQEIILVTHNQKQKKELKRYNHQIKKVFTNGTFKNN